MENKTIKFLLLTLLLFPNLTAIGQSYPGFLGKKLAIGYTVNICPDKRGYLYDGDKDMFKALVDHNYYLDYATSKYSSLSVNFIHQTVPFSINNSIDDTEIYRSYQLNGQPYDVYFTLNSGRAYFKNVALALKYNLYMRGKTIASPIGRSHYFKLAIIHTKMVEDNFEYYVNNKSGLTTAEYENIIIPVGVGTKATNLSIGYGLESKRMLTNSVFFKSNIELNFSTAFLNTNYAEEQTFSEQFGVIVNSATTRRNLLQFGFGLGMLIY